MKHEEIILMKKLTALNAIRKIYHPLTKHCYTFYDGEGSKSEQMSDDVRGIIEDLEKDLKEIKKSKTVSK